MTERNHPQRFYPLIWAVGTSFVLLQFFLQLSSGVVIDVIMHDMNLSGLSAGLLSGMFYVIYTSLQIPAGVLCDRKNPRPIVTVCVFICAIGCVTYANSYTLPGLYVGRALIALGSAFSFVCLTHLIREHYPLKQFGLLIGASETISFIAAVTGIIGLGTVINHWGWREFMNTAAMFACMIAYFCWRYIPNKPLLSENTPEKQSHIMAVLTSVPLWLNGLFLGLTFLLVTVFGALWAPAFLQIKLNCTIAQASFIDAIFILGIGISCPIFGYLGNRVKSRKLLIIRACIATALLLMMIIYLPIHDLYLMTTMMFILGLASGSYILGYTFANELSPPNALSTTTGFTNTLALITTPILQPLIGYVLDASGDQITLEDYQQALLILPVCILVAIVLVSCLKLPKLDTE
ncbi:MAG: MFS transporter [Legionella sp.]|nr:MAG: MFS transporter [Legionella sp.]